MSDTDLPQPMATADLEVIIELQKAELDRLLKENARLHQRIDQLIAMQEREQVLRQQMQTVLGTLDGHKQIGVRSELKVRAHRAEKRNAELKQALRLLMGVLERGQRR